MRRPLIAIDIGNTRIKAAIQSGENCHIEYLASPRDLSSFLQRHRPRAVIAASVRIDEKEIREILTPRDFPLTVFSSAVPLPFSLRYDPATDVGADRLAAAYWAWKRLAPPQQGLVIIAGTCITYNVITPAAFLGGAISPGLTMRLQSMHAFTHRLPRVPPPRSAPSLDHPAGTTPENLQLGALGGMIGEMEGFVRRWEKTMGSLRTWGSGGDWTYICSHLSKITHVPHLVLKGLLEYLRDEVLR